MNTDQDLWSSAQKLWIKWTLSYCYLAKRLNEEISLMVTVQKDSYPSLLSLQTKPAPQPTNPAPTKWKNLQQDEGYTHTQKERN